MKSVYTAQFSGGRSSAFMVKMLLDAGAPVDHILFANTGLESPETYAFIEACNEQLFGGRLVMVENYSGGGLVGDRVDLRVIKRVADLDRAGGPMRASIEGRRLPNRRRRTCTTELKVEAAFHYLYGEHDYKATIFEHYIGLRADEPRRLARLKATNELFEERINAGKAPLKWSALRYAPLAEARISRAEVLQFYRDHPLRGLAFDPADERVRLSNCEGCMMGNHAYFLDVAQRRPEVAQFWDGLETSIWDQGKAMKSDDALVRRRLSLKKLGVREPTAFESKGYAVADVPWRTVIRLAEVAGPAQGELIDAGGCESGACNLDI